MDAEERSDAELAELATRPGKADLLREPEK
jgi:hypothetical protein